MDEAAAATDDPKAAAALLKAYAKDARIKNLTLTPAAPAGEDPAPTESAT